MLHARTVILMCDGLREATASCRRSVAPAGPLASDGGDMPNRNRSWPYRTGQAESPPSFTVSPDGLLVSSRSLAGPLRLGTEPRVGPRGNANDGGAYLDSDLGVDRITPRGFDPMGTSDTRAPPQEASELISR